ncbi:hypothetical protein GN244_ATG07364 [Phytophthora infestans]|uniref:Secreted protein n=1 Tax=Phytophthora infestans TaxID=4787 RepID=A0A833T6D4_PHYIN|nr:hypothetical protein GN244_ATG07364 [Phytophthora infestans]
MAAVSVWAACIVLRFMERFSVCSVTRQVVTCTPVLERNDLGLITAFALNISHPQQRPALSVVREHSSHYILLRLVVTVL